MQSEFYPRPRDLAEADPGIVAALVPHLLNEVPHETLVAIPIGLEGPLHVVHQSLYRLDYAHDEDLTEFSAALSDIGAIHGWIIGYAEDPADVARALTRVSEYNNAIEFVDRSTVLAVTESGTRWGRLADYTDPNTAIDFAPVPSTDPAWAHLTAIAIRAHTVRAAAMRRLGLPETFSDIDQLSAANDQVARLRTLAARADAAVLAAGDKDLLEDLLSRMRPISAPEAINLGAALAADPVLYARAVDHILDRTPPSTSRCELWSELTRHALGPARRVCASLAALAAWHDGDPIQGAAAAVLTARWNEQTPPAVAAVAAILDAGATAKDLRLYLHGSRLQVASGEATQGNNVEEEQ
ncbi:DUF4192 family protein [Glycomyces luteolus]|uniref:DUF4192 family protein n=1 Tax=Glycomyces luteolus TaxID=2670330 RepID=A0A9X3PA35_9ACTN|nr:DUF4192 family protein [Glycomyces luteolus]MDA1359777.1 DUF4192 family protein [Glycomyces luteolus]